MIVILISCGIVFLLLIVFMIRNDRTYSLRQKVNDMCYQWNHRHVDEIISGKERSSWDWSYNIMPSYDSMLWSVKRLRLEKFLSKEVIEKLQS